MRVIYFKRDIVPIMIVRDQPTVFPVAQVLSKLKRGKRKIWMFRSPTEARRIGIRICYDTLGVEESESFRLCAFIIRRPRSIRYGLELVAGRKLCALCQCDMAYEKYGMPVCKYHYRRGEDDPPCPTCQPSDVVVKVRKPCSGCGGTGTSPLDGMVGMSPATCSVCGGSGVKPSKKRKRS